MWLSKSNGLGRIWTKNNELKQLYDQYIVMVDEVALNLFYSDLENHVLWTWSETIGSASDSI